MPDINSVSPDIRDFLLNRNLIADTVTNNGLGGLLLGVGTAAEISHQPEAVQGHVDIQEDGVFYKDLAINTNRFKGSADQYRTASIEYTSNPPSTAYIYTSNYVEESGVLAQSEDIRDANIAFNLYDDKSLRTITDMSANITSPNVKYTNYKDLNSYIYNTDFDVLGTIFGGGQIGIGTNGEAVPNFDLRASLLGRVLGGTGVISDTPLGQAGAKYLALALANNAAFNLQQETIGHVNLNPLSIAMNGTDSIIVPNYNITVPKSSLGKVLDFGARVLGFEVPVSLLDIAGSIFGSENPVSNIDRALCQIQNTGKGQVLSLFANLKENTFLPTLSDSRIKDGVGKQGDEGTNSNIYAFGTTDGKVIDFLNNNISVDFDRSNSSEPNEFDPNTPISQSNYRLSQMIENDGFNGVKDSTMNPLDFVDFDGKAKFMWGDDKDNKASKEVFETTLFTAPNSILTKTQGLFNSNRMRTLVGGKVSTGNSERDPIQSAVRQGGLMSKGSGVLSNAELTGLDKDGNPSIPNIDEVFCRTFTTFDRYDRVEKLQKNKGLSKKTAFRSGLNEDDSVLGSNGFVKIGPYTDDRDEKGVPSNIKNFMFSLENLAWADNNDKLLPCETGLGDPSTGAKGRIMWFPPYDITVNENTAVSLESTNFIGRGEPVYTYNNTERTGTLQFKIIVDHPSYLNALKSESDDYIASYFAGCTEIDSELAKNLTTIERDIIQASNVTKPPKVAIEPEPIDIKTVDFFFSNDNATLNVAYENKFDPNGGLGQTDGSKKYGSKTIGPYDDRNDFGLNGDRNKTLDGGWISTAGKLKLKEVLNDACSSCRINIEGFASTQGNTSGNKLLSIDRAAAVKKWFIDEILEDNNKGSIEERFSGVAGKGETGCLKDKSEGRDDICEKEARKVTVNFVFDNELYLINHPEVIKQAKKPIPEKGSVSQKIINRFYNECNYFEKVKADSPTVYASIKEKIKFFQPAFHSMTPEGLNSRLTFLQQCTRQGPTNITGKPDNLAFGRPPVCILRLGDFYHTKIMIDNLGISYEPLVWDLNPEGVGVQPMIATVDISYKMIGGQSMKGPINQLQNAVSFNFFGNTQVYDVRSARLKDGNIVPGEKVLKDANIILEPAAADTVGGSGGNVENNQSAEGASNNEQDDNETSTDYDIITDMKFNISTNAAGQLEVNYLTLDPLLKLSNLTKDYDLSIQVLTSTGVGYKDAATFKITTANDNGTITSTGGLVDLVGGFVADSSFGATTTIKIEVKLGGDGTVTDIQTLPVAHMACITAGFTYGQILTESENNTFKENVINNTCNP